MPNATDRLDHGLLHPAAPRDRSRAVRRAQHIARLLEQDHEALRRAIEIAAALRSFASACADLGESLRLGHP
jgi:hypothetical protein